MAHHFQAALFHLGGILHTQSACRGVAWVGEFILAVGRALLIDLREVPRAHVYLAANLNKLRDRIFSSTGQLVRNILDNTSISSDFLAHRAIASGSGSAQASVAIDQIDRQPIDLKLGEIGLCRSSI